MARIARRTMTGCNGQHRFMAPTITGSIPTGDILKLGIGKLRTWRKREVHCGTLRSDCWNFDRRHPGSGPYKARERWRTSLHGREPDLPLPTQGRKIFSRSVWHRLHAVGNLAEEKYPSKGIEDVSREYFGDTRLNEALTEVLVIAPTRSRIALPGSSSADTLEIRKS